MISDTFGDVDCYRFHTAVVLGDGIIAGSIPACCCLPIPKRTIMSQSDLHNPSIAVIGADAIGGLFAARLHEAGCSVTLVPSMGSYDTVVTSRVRLSSNGIIRAIPVPCVRSPADLTEVDLVLLATKAGAVEEVARSLEAFDSPGLGVLTLQNGVEAGEQVARALPRSDVLSARVHGFFELVDGCVEHVGVEPSVSFGPIRPERGRAGPMLLDVFDRARIDCAYIADIAPVLWEKFMLAAAIGGVGTALGVPVGQIRSVEGGQEILAAAMREIASLAQRCGVSLDQCCIDHTLNFVTSFPPAVTSSLQRDLLAGRPSEFGTLTGAVPRLAARVGLAVPVHEQLIASIAARGLLN